MLEYIPNLLKCSLSHNPKLSTVIHTNACVVMDTPLYVINQYSSTAHSYLKYKIFIRYYTDGVHILKLSMIILC